MTLLRVPSTAGHRTRSGAGRDQRRDLRGTDRRRICESLRGRCRVRRRRGSHLGPASFGVRHVWCGGTGGALERPEAGILRGEYRRGPLSHVRPRLRIGATERRRFTTVRIRREEGRRRRRGIRRLRLRLGARSCCDGGRNKCGPIYFPAGRCPVRCKRWRCRHVCFVRIDRRYFHAGRPGLFRREGRRRRIRLHLVRFSRRLSRYRGPFGTVCFHGGGIVRKRCDDHRPDRHL